MELSPKLITYLDTKQFSTETRKLKEPLHPLRPWIKTRYGRRGGENTVEWLRALTVLPEDPSSIPCIHMAAYNCL